MVIVEEAQVEEAQVEEVEVKMFKTNKMVKDTVVEEEANQLVIEVVAEEDLIDHLTLIIIMMVINKDQNLNFNKNSI